MHNHEIAEFLLFVPLCALHFFQRFDHWLRWTRRAVDDSRKVIAQVDTDVTALLGPTRSTRLQVYPTSTRSVHTLKSPEISPDLPAFARDPIQQTKSRTIVERMGIAARQRARPARANTTSTAEPTSMRQPVHHRIVCYCLPLVHSTNIPIAIIQRFVRVSLPYW